MDLEIYNQVFNHFTNSWCFLKIVILQIIELNIYHSREMPCSNVLNFTLTKSMPLKITKSYICWRKKITL